MTRSCSSLATPVRIVSLALAPATFGLATPAAAETRAGADVSLGGTAASNPYQGSQSNGRISATAEITPWVRLLDAQSSVELRGNLLVNQYSEAPHTDINGSLTLSGSKQFSSTVSVNGRLGYRSSRSGIHSALLNRADPADQLPPITAQLPDVAFGGNRSRSESYDANLGLSLALSPRDQVGINVSASRSDYNLAIAKVYNFYNGGVNYSRSVSDSTSLTASLVVGRPQYIGTRVGDGTILTPQLGIQQRLSQDIMLSASVGAAFVRSNRADGTVRSFTTLSGNVSLCRKRELSAFCVSGSREAQPTAVGGVRATTSVALNYDGRFSLRDSFSVTGTWTRNNDSSLSVIDGPASFYGLSTTVRREFNRRLSVFVSPSYSKFTNAVRSGENVQISAGLRFSFGAIS